MKHIEKEIRPWGKFYVLISEEKYKIKRIEVEKGQRLSYQFHSKRSETWVIISGEANVTINDITSHHKAGDTVIISLGAKHRIENIGSELLILIEVQIGSYFGEDDIVRLEDDYKRLK